MSHLSDKSTKKYRSLKTNYIVFSVVAAITLVISSTSSSLYVANVTHNNALALQLRDTVTKSVNRIRQANQEADITLSAMLVSPKKQHSEKITQVLKDATEEISNLQRLSFSGGAKTNNIISDLYSDTDKLQTTVSKLFEKISDPNWVYPMLPYINNILLESNTEFESAATLALLEIAEEEGETYSSPLYREIAQIRDLWRLQILNFRAVIVRFAGMNRIERIPQEKNITLVNNEIKQKIIKLEKLKQQGKLGFETEEAIDVMQYRAKKWYDDYQKVQQIRNSKIWRADIYFIETLIRPLQVDIREDLEQLETAVLDWSSKNTAAVERAAFYANLQLWGMTVAAILFVILVYSMISRTVLKPIAKIASIITEEGKKIDSISLPNKSSREIYTLISAYNTMRQQIHHRQVALEHQALHDSLTGLPNRALLQDRLEQAIQQSKRHKSSIALILLDLDRFKDINDTLGHTIGDRVLQEVSTRLNNCLRTSDTVARLGGDEFAMVCPDINTEQVRLFIEKIIEKISRPINISAHNLYVGISIGITLFPENSEDADILLRQADIAMYDAKRNKKDFSFFHHDLDEISSDNISILGDLKKELNQNSGDLSLYYQPQIDIRSNAIYGVEALLHWNHPVHGKIAPDDVIRMSEQSGLIGELTNWVLEKAIKDCTAWAKNGLTVNVSVNLSVWNLQDPELPSHIQQLLKLYDLAPNKLILEITESAVMNDPIRAREVLKELSSMGIQLDIDDYGTGFSSLSYLKMLPVNGLKIDKSFIIEMEEDNSDRVIVQSTIDLAHNLNLTVTAEGVETASALELLKQHNCDYAQGYFVARPMPNNEFEKWSLNYNKSS